MESCVLVDHVTKEMLWPDQWHHLVVKYSEEYVTDSEFSNPNLTQILGTVSLILSIVVVLWLGLFCSPVQCCFQEYNLRYNLYLPRKC